MRSARSRLCILVLPLSLIALSCQPSDVYRLKPATVGTRCRAGDLARSSAFVLQCQRGRWRASSSIAGVVSLINAANAKATAVAVHRRLLVFSRTTGFRHESITDGTSMLTAQLPGAGIEVAFTEDPSMFTDAGLARFGAVLFLSTTGDVLDDTQQGAFERFVHRGGGYIGVHSASDTEYDWPFYGQLVGAWFQGHPQPTEVPIRVEAGDQLSTASLPSTFSLVDEVYDFRTNPRSDPATKVLLSIDPAAAQTGGWTMGADHPISWQKEFAGGRSFYTNLGHMAETWRRPEFVSHLVGGIRWVLGN